MVRIDKLSKKYNSVVALDNINLRIDKAELFGVIGPDGAGKTSLFRILASLLLPSDGKAAISGYDVVKDYRDIRKITGYMPGQFSLYTDLSVLENLQFFASVFGVQLKENYELIEEIYKQIEPFKDRLAGKLSGGMKQKLALSCSLIHRPGILILDEPTTGVDAVSRKEFWELLKGLKKKGITIVVSTPYMDEALQCDRVALIQSGKLLSVDIPNNITGSYKKQIYNVSSKHIPGLINDLRSFQTVKHAFAFGQYVHYTDVEADFNPENLRSYLVQKGHEDIIISETKPGIEDVFIDLMHVES